MIAQYSLLDKIELISIPDEALATEPMKKILAVPGRTIDEIKPGVYGKNQTNTEPVRVVGSWVGLSTYKDMDADIVYKLTKTLFEHIDELHAAAPFMSTITKDTALLHMNAPLHPGALEVLSRSWRRDRSGIDPAGLVSAVSFDRKSYCNVTEFGSERSLEQRSIDGAHLDGYPVPPFTRHVCLSHSRERTSSLNLGCLNVGEILAFLVPARRLDRQGYRNRTAFTSVPELRDSGTHDHSLWVAASLIHPCRSRAFYALAQQITKLQGAHPSPGLGCPCSGKVERPARAPTRACWISSESDVH